MSMKPMRMARHLPPGTKEPGPTVGVIKKITRTPKEQTKPIKAAENQARQSQKSKEEI